MAGSIRGSGMSEAALRFLRHRLAVGGLGLVLLLVVLAVAARLLAPHDPIRQDLPHALAGPSLEFPLGTDEFGRCILSRILDVLLAFPSILLAIAVVAALGPSLVNVMIAVGVRSIPSYARLARSMVLSLKELEFVQGATALGASHPRVLFRHILPNSVSPLLVFSSMQIATAILLAAILSFLGLGVHPASPSSWL